MVTTNTRSEPGTSFSVPKNLPDTNLAESIGGPGSFSFFLVWAFSDAGSRKIAAVNRLAPIRRWRMMHGSFLRHTQPLFALDRQRREKFRFQDGKIGPKLTRGCARPFLPPT